MIKVGINGFGRIGRLAFRIGLTKHVGNIDFTAINTSGSMNADGWAHLVNYDTMYRKFEKEIIFENTKDSKEATDEDPLIGYLKINNQDQKFPILAQKDPTKIPWGKYQVDVVIESTGKFTTIDEAKKHNVGGAKRVIISAPSKGGNIGTYVLGVNEYQGEATVISNASCTTNCIAPVAAILHGQFGIEKAMMTTIGGARGIADNSCFSLVFIHPKNI
ncbi:MAG: Glyceraldehyde-3-phosphate dehydrogenase, partial [candidate division WWE3 bacterium GW2011_GWA1_41_8]